MAPTDEGVSRTRAGATERPDALTALATLWGHTSRTFAISAFGVLMLGFLNVIVLTRFLDPSEYGELAILLVFSSMLTVIYGLGSLQGTLLVVFGSAGEEDVEDTDDEATAPDKKGALGTGLLLTTIVVGLGTAAVAATSGDLAGWLLGDGGKSDLILLAAISGGIAAIWRLASNVARMERRPETFAILHVARPALALAAAIPLVVADGGVTAVLIGFAIGNAAALLTALVANRGSYEFRFNRRLVPRILRRGVYLVPIIGGFWVVQNVDTLLLTRFVSAADIGFYRVAGRVASFGSYLSSAFLMAWGPMRLTATWQAVEKERGSESVRGEIVAYFIFGGLWLVVGMAIAADLLVRIAPSSYASAAPLIPLLAAGFVAHGALTVTYRAGRFPRRQLVYAGIVLACAAAFFPLALWLIGAYGTTGAAVAGIVIFLLGALGVGVVSQTGPNPIEFRYRRMLLAGLSAAICLGAAIALKGAPDPWRQLGEIAALLAYPVLLVVMGAVPREDLEVVRRVGRSLLPVRDRRGRHWRPSLQALDPQDATMLELAVRHQWSPRDLASMVGGDESDVRARLVSMLRVLGSIDSTADDPEADSRIGAYLLSPAIPAERDALAKSLYKRGLTTPSEIDALERTLQGLRALPRSTWDAQHPPGMREPELL